MLYLDHAATGYPKPPQVVRAITKTMAEAGGNPGRGIHTLSTAAAGVIYGARETAAAFFGGDAPERVLFFPNATYALNTVLRGVPTLFPAEHRHVLISEMEHNAVIRPLHAMREAGVTFDTYPVFRNQNELLSEEEILSGIRQRIRGDTVLVCACHVSNVCGACLPIRKIGALCRERGLLFAVDASQSAGVWDISVPDMHIDYLCSAGHKALLGPQGSGLLMLGEGAPIPPSLVQGGNGVASLSAEMPDFLPEALEAGTLATPSVAGLRAGMEVIRSYGKEALREEVFALYRRLREMLLSVPQVTLYQGGCTEGTTLSFNLAGWTPGQVAEALADRGCCVRSGFHCTPLPHKAFGTETGGFVRVSVGYGNRPHDAERFWHLLSELLHA